MRGVLTVRPGGPHLVFPVSHFIVLLYNLPISPLQTLIVALKSCTLYAQKVQNFLFDPHASKSALLRDITAP